MNNKAKFFVVEFLKIFLGRLFYSIPFLVFCFWFYKCINFFPGVLDSLASSSYDPVVIVSVFAGLFGGSIFTYFWYGITGLCEFFYKRFRKSSGKKSVDQKEV